VVCDNFRAQNIWSMVVCGVQADRSLGLAVVFAFGVYHHPGTILQVVTSRRPFCFDDSDVYLISKRCCTAEWN